MKTWLRWLLLTISVGGGFTGLVLNFQMFFHPQFEQPIYVILIGAFTVLYGFVLVAGLLFADDPNYSTPLLIALCLQIPSISSPILVYRFSTGLPIIFSIMGGKLSASVRLGGEWQFNLFQEFPWGFGIDLCALILFILLITYRRRNLHNLLQSHKSDLKISDYSG